MLTLCQRKIYLTNIYDDELKLLYRRNYTNMPSVSQILRADGFEISLRASVIR